MTKKGIAVYKSGSATDVTFQFLDDGSSVQGAGYTSSVHQVTGALEVTGTLKLDISGTLTSGFVLTTDGVGNASWQAGGSSSVAAYADEAGKVTNALTGGTGVTPFTYDGSSTATVAIDESIVVTLTGTQTLTNKTVSGAFSGTFQGDGSALSGVTAEWDGTHVGDAQITGTLYVTEGVEAQSFTGSLLGDIVGDLTGNVLGTSSFSDEAAKVSSELTDGTGITDFTYDGSSPATVSIDQSIVVTLTGSQTLTNKIISGTFSGSHTGSFTGSFIGDGSGLTGLTGTVSDPLSGALGIVPFTYDGSSAQSVAIDDTIIATLTGTQTLTNKTITGSFSGDLVGDVTGNVLGTSSFADEAAKVSSELTDGTGITDFTYDGSSPATVSIDESIVVTLTGTQTLTNKIISGTFSGSHTGSFTGSFAGDGSGLTGVTAEWDGTLIGDAQITGTLFVTEGVEAQSFTGSLLGDVVGNLTGNVLGTASFADEAAKVSSELTDGTGITDFTYDGSSPATVSIDESIVVTLTGSQTLTNKIISGTFSGSHTGSFTGSFIGDGSGLTGVSASVGAAGNENEIQYNSGGDLTASSGLVYSGTVLLVTSSIETTSITGALLGDVVGTASFADEAAKVSSELTDGTGITNFTYDGSSPATVSIDESIVVTLTGTQTLTNKIISGTFSGSHTGSFTGSFAGDGSGLTGITGTVSLPLTGAFGIVPFTYDGSSTADVAVDDAVIVTLTGSQTLTNKIISGTFSGSHTGSFTGSFAGDGSGLTGVTAVETDTLDDVTTRGSTTANSITVGSFLSNGDSVISGNLDITNVLTAREFHTQIISSSIIYDSGSTKFGDSADDFHQFTGSIGLVSGNVVAPSFTGSFLGDLVGTASEANKVTDELVDGTGITDFTYDGSSPATVSIDESIVVTLTGTQTLTNKIISGSFSGSFTGSFLGDGSGLTGVTSSTSEPLTGAFGIVPFTYDGTSTADVAVDDTVIVTLTGSQTLTNKIISGTFSGSHTGSFTGSFIGDGSGLTGINTGSGTPGGNDQSVQFNSGSAFSGSDNFTFDYNTNTLTLTGTFDISGSGAGAVEITGTLDVLGNVSASGFYGDLIGTASEASKVTNALSDGTGISTFTYDGSSTATVAIDQAIVVTLTGSQTLTNKIISGTFSGSHTGSFTGSFAGDGSGLTGITSSGGGTPGGNDQNIQFNSGSTFSGSDNLNFDYTNNILTLTGTLEVSGSGAGAVEITGTLDVLGNVSASGFYGDLFGTASEASKVTNELTDGTGITDFTYDGSSPATVSIDQSIVVTLTGSQTLTNKIISGTFSGSHTGSFTGSFIGDGSGLTGINTGSGTPGGNDKSVQFNSGSEFSGSDNFTFDYDTNTLSLTGGLDVAGDILVSGAAPQITLQSVPASSTSFTIRVESDNSVSFLSSIGTWFKAGPTNIIDFSPNQLKTLDRGMIVKTTSSLSGVADHLVVNPEPSSGPLPYTSSLVVASTTGYTGLNMKGTQPQYQLDVAGDARITGSLYVTGAIDAGSITGSFLGDLVGTASEASQVTNALSDGTGITTFTYDGSSLATVSIDQAIVVTLTGSQTLTNKIISGTFSGSHTGSFTGSFAGDGSGLTGLPTGSATTPGGVDRNIQFNSGSTFSGSDNLNFDYDNNILTLTGTLEVSGTGAGAVEITGTLDVLGNVSASGFYGDLFGTASEASSVTNALSDGTGITTFTYDGSSAETVSIDSTVVTLTGVQTLTNKIITGSFSGSHTGSFTGSFAGDGSGLTGVTAEWDGTRVGDAQITGTLYVTEGVEAQSFTGSLLGDVVGNLTGNVLGDLVGDVTGNLLGTASFADEAAKVSNALTASYGVVPFTYDGSSTAHVGVDTSLIVTLTGSQTLTNKIISGTFSGSHTGSFTGSFAGDGSGLTGIPTGSATVPGGVDQNIQFNSGSTFSGSDNLNFDYDTNTLTLTGTLEVSGSGAGAVEITGTLDVLGNVSASGFYGDLIGTASEASSVTNALSDGTGITTFTYDGSSVETVSIDQSIVVTLTGSQTLTNKIISGTFSGSHTGSFTGSFAGDGSGLTGVTAAETDTLDDVTTRGNTTTNNIVVGGITSSAGGVITGSFIITGSAEITGTLDVSGNVSASGFYGDLIGTASEASKVTNSLVDGTGISNFTYDGSSLATVEIDQSIVVTLTGSQTLTNKIISGTFSGSHTGSFTGSFFGDGSGLTGVSTVPGGVDQNIQFNSGSTFSGSDNLNFDYDTNTLTLTGTLEVSGSGAGAVEITGTLDVLGNVSASGFYGDLIGTASFATEAGKVTNALSEGTGITSFTYDGSSVATVSIDQAIVVTLTGSQTLTNKIITGSFNGDLVGDVTGNLLGNVVGDITGDVTGNVLGNLTGDVTGNVLGDLTGDVTGNVLGNITGDLVGTASFATEAGKVSNALTGGTGITSFTYDGSSTATVEIDSTVVTLTGVQTLTNKTITGSFSGDLVGDVTGNVLGNLTGDVTGNVLGNLTGDVTGNVLGDVVGNLTGNVLGDLIGDVTGNLLGTASYADEAGKVTNALTGGHGIEAFTYDGSATATVIVASGSIALVDSTGKYTYYSTISGAVAASTSGNAVRIGPGTYTETTPIDIPAGVSVIGDAGWQVTTVEGTSATGTRFRMSNGSLLKDLKLQIPTDSGSYGASFSGSGGEVASINFLSFYGQTTSTGSGYGQIGPGKTIGLELRYSTGPCDAILEVTDGILACEGVHVPNSAGAINAGVRATGPAHPRHPGKGRFQGVDINMGATNVEDAIQVNDTATVVMLGANLFNVQNSFHLTSNSASLTVTSGLSDPAVSDLKVDSGLTGDASVTRITAHMNGKFDIPYTWIPSDHAWTFFTEESTTSETSFQLWGADFVVGHPERGGDVSLGEGESYSTNNTVLTTDNTAATGNDGANFIDVSVEAKSTSGSTFSFQSASAGSSILWCTNRLDENGDTLKYWGTKTEQVGAATLGGGSFIWEIQSAANTWTEVGIMAASTEDQYVYANDIFLRASSVETLRAGIDDDTTWPATTINGTLGHWMRVRIDSTITTAPTFERLSLSPSYAFTNRKGQLSAHGLAQWRSQLFGVGNVWGEIDGGGTKDATIAVGSGGEPTGWGQKIKKGLLNSDGDSLSFQFQIPDGICSAYPFYFDLFYSVDGAATTGIDVTLSALVLSVGSVEIADSSGGIVPVERDPADAEVFTSKAATAITVTGETDVIAETQQVMRFGPYDISDYYEGDAVVMRVELTDDDGGLDMTLWTLAVNGVRFTTGGRI